MTHPLKRLCSIAVSLLAISGLSTAVAQTPANSANPQAWPSKSITLVVTYAAGGFADTRMRLLARKLTDKLGQSVVVENKSGAGGVIGTAVIAKAPPDGYTIGSGNLAPLAVNTGSAATGACPPASCTIISSRSCERCWTARMSARIRRPSQIPKGSAIPTDNRKPDAAHCWL